MALLKTSWVWISILFSVAISLNEFTVSVISANVSTTEIPSGETCLANTSAKFLSIEKNFFARRPSEKAKSKTEV